MNIREYTPHDHTQLLELDKKAASGALALYSQSAEGPFQQIQDFFDAGGCIWVAEDDNTHQIVGSIGLKVQKTSIGKMKALRVDPDHQRKGVAKKLIETLEVYSKEHNLSKIVLGVDEKSQAAIRLYESLGYVPTHTKDFPSGEKAVYYEKTLM